MRFTVLAILLFGACMVDPSGTEGDDGGGGTIGSAGSGSSGSAGSGSGTTGGSMLPAELVGTWQDIESDAAISYQFTAQGEVVYAGDLATSDGCTYEVQTSYTGTVALQGNVITLTPVDGEQATDDCGDTSTSAFTKVEVDAFEVDGSVLYLQNQNTGVVLTLSQR